MIKLWRVWLRPGPKPARHGDVLQAYVQAESADEAYGLVDAAMRYQSNLPDQPPPGMYGQDAYIIEIVNPHERGVLLVQVNQS